MPQRVGWQFMGHMVWNVVLPFTVMKFFISNLDVCKYTPWNVFWKYRAANDRHREDNPIKN